ncbi:hypothetical protein BU24DRAFT_468749 [Aaosphaeria arxii CBS 175.79]|uniref:Uncharacterized protein n=1 Tax=Aaosphaeria arxii CBS 175.79 TaxID=1450172 RepID=A0A6A5X714_9PLEO|nr:uncharacterized protein BU24DRAFT_468749 [Aaosphaeria arxii CBS 175.79]KAF2008637.1 hypothetical protein BU24DRAFT_468749 [Aaosphaeria arxii CBS 175.79]
MEYTKDPISDSDDDSRQINVATAHAYITGPEFAARSRRFYNVDDEDACSIKEEDEQSFFQKTYKQSIDLTGVDEIEDSESSSTDNPPLHFNISRALDLDNLICADAYRESLVSGDTPRIRTMMFNISRELALSPTVQSADRNMLTAVIWRILTSTNSSILESVLAGDIAKRWHSSPEVKYALQRTRIQARSAKQPCIYMNVFTDNKGRCPSMKTYIQILDMMEMYAHDGVLDREQEVKILRVDRQFGDPNRWQLRDVKSGKRRYIDGNTKGRIAYIRIFIGKVRERIAAKLGTSIDQLKDIAALEEAGLDLSARFDPAFTEVGYTSQSEDRLKAHREYRSSNYMMNLFEAICHSMGHVEFAIHNFVVYLIWQLEQAAVAEMVFTCLANATIQNGKGFSFYPSGLSVNSAYEISHSKWESLTAHMLDESPFENNNRQEASVQSMIDDRLDEIALSDILMVREARAAIEKYMNQPVQTPEQLDQIEQYESMERRRFITKMIRAAEVHHNLLHELEAAGEQVGIEGDMDLND